MSDLIRGSRKISIACCSSWPIISTASQPGALRRFTTIRSRRLGPATVTDSQETRPHAVRAHALIDEHQAVRRLDGLDEAPECRRACPAPRNRLDDARTLGADARNVTGRWPDAATGWTASAGVKSRDPSDRARRRMRGRGCHGFHLLGPVPARADSVESVLATQGGTERANGASLRNPKEFDARQPRGARTRGVD